MGVLKLADRVRYDSMLELPLCLDKVRLPGKDEIHVRVVKGDYTSLPTKVREFIAENVRLCQPKGIYICDGSEEEAEAIREKMVARGLLVKLDKYDNWLYMLYKSQMKNEKYR